MLNGREKTDVPKSFASMPQIESVMAMGGGSSAHGKKSNTLTKMNLRRLSVSSSSEETSTGENASIDGQEMVPAIKSPQAPPKSFHLTSSGHIPTKHHGHQSGGLINHGESHQNHKRGLRTPEEKMSTGSDNAGGHFGGGETFTPFTESRLSSEHPEDFVDSCSCTDVTLDENIRINHNHR